MDRRAFVAGTLAFVAAPLAAEAQTPRVYRVGVILQGDPYYPAIDGLRDGLRGLGFEEGKQFVLSVRDAKGDLKAVEAAARSLEGEKVDLIYAVAASVSVGVKRATQSVPIVFYSGRIGQLSAKYVQRVLLGANPGDLPVEGTDRVHFAINLKTAKALGLTIPPSVLARADEVIQ